MVIQQTPSAVVAVFPFVYKQTYDFTARQDLIGNRELMETSPRPYEIQNRAVSLATSSLKGSHSGSFSGTFIDPDGELISTVAPDDWIAVWMTDNEEDARKISEALQKGEPSNWFNSGLKFLGRVESVRELESQNANGLRTVRAVVNATSFSELEASVYYNPYMRHYSDATAIVTQASESVQTRIPPSGPGRTLFEAARDLRDTSFSHLNDLLPLAVQLFLGGGPRDRTQLQKDWNPNDAYLVPQSIGSLLGIDPTEASLTYADILSVLVGVQTYRAREPLSISETPNPQAFLPVLDEKKTVGNVFFTDRSIISVFNPLTTAWSGTPFIQILQGYLAPALNEMYTSLRPLGPGGALVPQLIVRQRPFTSEEYRKGENQIWTTPFLSLPKWKIERSSIISKNVGRSRTMNFNYSEIQPTMGDGNSIVTQTAVSAGIASFNSVGSRRNGLRPLITSVTAGMEDIAAALMPGKVWEERTLPEQKPTDVPQQKAAPTIWYPTGTDEIARISSGFGMRHIDGSLRQHNGIDIPMPVGTAIYAYEDGEVTRAGWEDPTNRKKGYGQVVFIDHKNGVYTVYAHLSKINVKVGDKVTAATILGESGNTGSSTGPHLHFEMRVTVESTNSSSKPTSRIVAVDPLIYVNWTRHVHGTPKWQWGRATGKETPPAPIFGKDGRVGNQWSEFVSDIAFEGHLKFTGSYSLMGVQAPISVGDNVEVDNIVFHIEGVDHSLSVDPATNKRMFRTTLNLTNGIMNTPGEVTFPRLATAPAKGVDLINTMSSGGLAIV